MNQTGRGEEIRRSSMKMKRGPTRGSIIESETPVHDVDPRCVQPSLISKFFIADPMGARRVDNPAVTSCSRRLVRQRCHSGGNVIFKPRPVGSIGKQNRDPKGGRRSVDMVMEGISLSDTVFSFFEEGGGGESSDGSGGFANVFDSDDEGTSESTVAENKAFWESQQHIVQDALSRTSSTEIKLLQRTRDAVNKMQAEGIACTCSNRTTTKDFCRNCALVYIARQLHELGYGSALCKSKWKKSPDFPSGEHSYIDVMMERRNRKKGPIRLVIDLNFRAEFEMARGNHEYKNLVSLLPEIFVGTPEKLQGVVKMVCSAAKKCMKDKKMHMAPWRKHKYMQSKWLGTPERTTTPAISFPVVDSERQPKMKASLLTFDLHCPAVEVV